MFEYKQVIMARGDLDMTPGKLAVQVAHASLGASEEARREKFEWFSNWIKEKQKKVVVRVSNGEKLSELNEKARRIGIPTKLVKDAGLTELPPNTSTTSGIGPGPSEIIDKITGNLPLW